LNIFNFLIIMSRKIDKPDHPPLYMDSNDISTVSEHKHLGLDISDNGTTISLPSHGFLSSHYLESAVSFGSSTIRYKLVSSANSFIVDCISVTM
jgi:hypothetical protein